MTDSNVTENLPAVMTMRLIGGALCLDFANTVGGREPDTGVLRNERLHDYADLVLWGQHVGLLTESAANHLIGEGKRRAVEAQAILQRAEALREAIYNLFSAPLCNAPIRSESLEILNSVLAETMTHARIVEEHDGQLAWGWEIDDHALDRVLWDIVRSAADLLTSVERTKVRECDSPTCSWLFVDTSKNHHRRWCSMEECGNRAKVRKHRRKQQTG